MAEHGCCFESATVQFREQVEGDANAVPRAGINEFCIAIEAAENKALGSLQIVTVRSNGLRSISLLAEA